MKIPTGRVRLLASAGALAAVSIGAGLLISQHCVVVAVVGAPGAIGFPSSTPTPRPDPFSVPTNGIFHNSLDHSLLGSVRNNTATACAMVDVKVSGPTPGGVIAIDMKVGAAAPGQLVSWNSPTTDLAGTDWQQLHASASCVG